ncbi:MAG: hypothetical protein ABJB03_02750 [Rhodoglobus sp.]
MSDTPDRAKRPGGTPEGRRPNTGRPAKGAPANGRGPRRDDGPERAARPTGDRPVRPARDGERSARPARDGERPARPARDGERPARAGGDRPERPRREGDRVPGGPRGGRDSDQRLWTKSGAPARGDRDAREREVPEDRDPFGIRSVRQRHDDPEIPDDVKPADLDRIARNELKTLSKENAEGVAQHLVMAARLIEDDPALAHAHAVSAARRAGRIGVVRETLAITAYATGDYGLALRELRTYRRITGRDDQLPMMVDSERGLGRPEKALELGRSVPRASLPVAVQVELAIAMSGARLDLGQADAALAELQIPQLDGSTAFSYSPALFDAYATVLEELGRTDEAEQWWERSVRAAEAIDAGENADETEFIEIIEEDVEPGSDTDD